MEVSDRILLGNGWYRLWGLAFLVACLPSTLAFDSAPIPPPPFPVGRGRFLVFLCKGLRPLHPRGWVGCGTGRACQAGTRCRGSPRLGEKTIEQPFYWQCRQPRRGGTGGDGTIRRTRRRRLRWSSPPGRGEQVPPGGGLPSWSPAAPAFSLLSRPHPPDPLPLRGRGRFLVFLCKGLRPLHPRGWVGCGTGFACGKRVVAGGLPGRHWGMVGAHASGGGLAFLLACQTRL